MEIPDWVRGDAPPIVYEVDGDEYIAVATGGNSIQRSATGDAVGRSRSKARWVRHGGRHHRHQPVLASAFIGESDPRFRRYGRAMGRTGTLKSRVGRVLTEIAEIDEPDRGYHRPTPPSPKAANSAASRRDSCATFYLSRGAISRRRCRCFASIVCGSILAVNDAGLIVIGGIESLNLLLLL